MTMFLKQKKKRQVVTIRWTQRKRNEYEERDCDRGTNAGNNNELKDDSVAHIISVLIISRELSTN